MRKRGPKLRDEIVTLAHGAGGKASRALVEGLFLPELGNPLLDALGDAAVLELGGARLAFTTDSYVVKPLVFPGGDIGDLAVNGTVNDLAVSGATPRFLSAGFVIEEGFPIASLRRIAASMARAAKAASVVIATGDTKVVERGNADGLYVNTAGIGIVPAAVELGPERVRPGDRVLVSGTLGDHGMAVLIARGDLDLEVDLLSDTAPVHELAAALLELGGRPLDARSDPRRPRHRAERARRVSPASRSRWTSRPCRCARRSSAPARSSGSIRSTSPTRGSSPPSSHRIAQTRRSPCSAATRWAPRRRSSERCAPSPKGWCCWTPPSAAAASSTCSSAIRSRASADAAGSPRLRRWG